MQSFIVLLLLRQPNLIMCGDGVVIMCHWRRRGWWWECGQWQTGNSGHRWVFRGQSPSVCCNVTSWSAL